MKPINVTEETAMHTTFQHELAKARTADLHHRAAHERMAKAASRARRPQHTRSWPGHVATVLADRALRLLGARSPSPTR